MKAPAGLSAASNDAVDDNEPSSPIQARSPADVPSVLKKLEKWGDYASMGEPLAPTRFVPCKTPLSRQIHDNMALTTPPRHPLTVAQLLHEQAVLGRTVGLILDLSNHDCLYHDDIPQAVRYVHIQLVAKELPPPSFVSSVREAANAFWAESPHLYIAVHCAYGFNRTGFILCSYLIQEFGLSVDAALAAFQTARPPGVKHETFRQELRRRYEPCTTSGRPALSGSMLAQATAAAAALQPQPQPQQPEELLGCSGTSPRAKQATSQAPHSQGSSGGQRPAEGGQREGGERAGAPAGRSGTATSESNYRRTEWLLQLKAQALSSPESSPQRASEGEEDGSPCGGGLQDAFALRRASLEGGQPGTSEDPPTPVLWRGGAGAHLADPFSPCALFATPTPFNRAAGQAQLDNDEDLEHLEHCQWEEGLEGGIQRQLSPLSVTVSENESLGLSELFILEGLREAASTTAMGSLPTRDQNESLLQKCNTAPRLPRCASEGDMMWPERDSS